MFLGNDKYSINGVLITFATQQNYRSHFTFPLWKLKPFGKGSGPIKKSYKKFFSKYLLIGKKLISKGFFREKIIVTYLPILNCKCIEHLV